MEKIKQLIKGKKGFSEYLSFMIVILIVFALFASLIAFYPVYNYQQELNEEARQIARLVEVYGGVTPEVNAFIDELQATSKAAPTDAEISIAPVSGTWYNGSTNLLQLQEEFVVTLTKAVPIRLFQANMSGNYLLNVPISATAEGISEVFYKN